MAKQKARRRQLIVHGPIQSRIMFNAAFLPFAILALNTILVASFCRSLTSEAVAAGVELPSAMYLLVTSATFLFASAGFITVYVLLLSHRIAGPMYNISRVLHAFENGETDRRILLRKNDLLSPLSDDVNRFLDWAQSEQGMGDTAADETDESAAEPRTTQAADASSATESESTQGTPTAATASTVSDGTTVDGEPAQ